MSYAVIEAAAITVIQKHADFDANNTSRGDHRILGHGKERVLIITYGGHSQSEATLKRLFEDWTINLDLFVPWRGEMNTLETTFQTERQKVIDTFAQWPKLDGAAGVVKDMLTDGPPLEVLSQNKPVYKGQRMLLAVRELVDPSRQE